MNHIPKENNEKNHVVAMPYQQESESESVLSYAGNFEHLVKGDVNPRNGQYIFCATLLSVQANHLRGPEVNLSLIHSPSHNRDIGYGKGMDINLTSLDLDNHMLYFGSGDVIRLNLANTASADPHPDDFLIETSTYEGHPCYLLHYKNGEAEYLREDWPTIGMASLIRRENAFGEGVTFRWTNQGGLTALTEITDDQGSTLFIREVKNATRGYVRFICLNRYAFEIKSTNDQELKFSLPFDCIESEALHWHTLAMSGRGCLPFAIDRMTYASGRVDALTYDEQALICPQAAGFPVTDFPAVTILEVTDSFSPGKKITYNYSPLDDYDGHNHLGNRSRDSGGWKPYNDYLCDVVGDYRYAVQLIEHHENDEALNIVTTQVYDKYHNLTSALRRCGSTSTETLMTYVDSYELPFSEQLKTFRLPKAQTTIWKSQEGERTEHIVSDFDDAGNCKSQRNEQRGGETVFTWFDTRAAAHDDCPYWPFIHFLETETQTGPDALTAQTTRTKNHTYKMAGSGVVPYVTTQTERGLVSTYTYDTLGRRSVQQDTFNAAAASTLEYAYEVSLPVNELAVTTITRADNTSDTLTTLNVYDLLTGNEVEVVSSEGHLARVFFPDGRVDREIVSPDTEYEASKHYIYDDAAHTLTVTLENGLSTVLQADGFSRLCRAHMTHPGHDSFLVQEKVYNRLGQCITSTEYDYLLPGDPTEGEQRLSPLVTEFQYDGWGECDKTVHPDGRMEFTQFNPVTLLESTGITGLTLTQTQRQPDGLREVVTSFDPAGAMLGCPEVIRYDSLERMVSQQDINGLLTTYSYDNQDRLKQTYRDCTQANGSGILTQYDYAAHTPASLPETLQVNGRIVGAQRWDGLERLISDTIGDSTTEYHYFPGTLICEEKVLPGGAPVAMVYNSHIQDYDTVGGNAFLYNRQSGRCEQGVNGDNGQTTDMTWRVDGAPLSEKGVLGETRFHHTLRGRLTAVEYPSGATLLRYYDDVGRVRHEQQQEFLTRVERYDAFSRPEKITITGPHGLSQTQVIDWSDTPHSLSIARTASTYDGLVTQTESMTFQADGCISTRTLSEGEALLLKEDFTYDSERRLRLFTCEGPHSPTDASGRVIRSQLFTCDALNNVTQVNAVYAEGQEEECILSYDGADPCQLTKVEMMSAGTFFIPQYDEMGNQTNDPQQHQYQYDSTGRLHQVSDASGPTFYDYDAFGRLVRQTPASGEPIDLLYADGKLAGEQQGDRYCHYLRYGTQLMGHTITRQGAEVETALSVSLASGSPVMTQCWSAEQNSLLRYDFAWTPYGEMTSLNEAPATSEQSEQGESRNV